MWLKAGVKVLLFETKTIKTCYISSKSISKRRRNLKFSWTYVTKFKTILSFPVIVLSHFWSSVSILNECLGNFYILQGVKILSQGWSKFSSFLLRVTYLVHELNEIRTPSEYVTYVSDRFKGYCNTKLNEKKNYILKDIK